MKLEEVIARYLSGQLTYRTSECEEIPLSDFVYMCPLQVIRVEYTPT